MTGSIEGILVQNKIPTAYKGFIDPVIRILEKSLSKDCFQIDQIRVDLEDDPEKLSECRSRAQNYVSVMANLSFCEEGSANNIPTMLDPQKLPDKGVAYQEITEFFRRQLLIIPLTGFSNFIINSEKYYIAQADLNGQFEQKWGVRKGEVLRELHSTYPDVMQESNFPQLQSIINFFTKE